MERAISTIMAADVVGYCRLMQADDIGTLAQLKSCLGEVFEPLIGDHGGEVFKLVGDGVFAAFPSAVEAIRCAAEIQAQMAVRNAGTDPEKRLEFRIGLHVGEVIRDGEDLFGDGVNIAARVQMAGDPGRICVTYAVRDQVRRSVPFGFEDLGEQAFHNIEDPIRIFRLGDGSGEAAPMQPATRGGEPPVTLSERPSIAILPFQDLGGSPPEQCLADGMRLGIQSMLVQLPGLFLVNPGGVEPFRDAATPPAEAARSLNVRYVVSGTVQGAGSRVRVFLQLTDARENQVIWGDRIDHDVDDLFALQDAVADRVITSLGMELWGQGAGFHMAHSMPTARARELFFRSVSHLYRGTANDNALARGLFEQLVEECPGTGHGLGNVALTHFFDSFFDWSADKTWSEKNARIWADRSIDAGDVAGFGNVVNGNLELFAGHHDAAAEFGRNAVGIRASCPLAYGQLGQIQIFNGDPFAGIRSARYALELERVYPPWLLNVLATGYRDVGDHAYAIRIAKEAVRLRPEEPLPKAILCSSQMLGGQGQEARETADRLRRLDPAFSVSRHLAAQPYRESKQRDVLAAALEEAGLPI